MRGAQGHSYFHAACMFDDHGSELSRRVTDLMWLPKGKRKGTPMSYVGLQRWGDGDDLIWLQKGWVVGK